MAVSKVARSSSPNLFARQLMEVSAAVASRTHSLKSPRATGPIPVDFTERVVMFDVFKDVQNE